MREILHIHPAYPWFCGSNDLARLGTIFSTTNEKDVACPDCLAKKKQLEGINLNHHPLADFFTKVAEEYDAGLAKYGPWDEMTDYEQKCAVLSEIYEVKAAILKNDNGAREKGELPQLANVCGKRFIELTRK